MIRTRTQYQIACDAPGCGLPITSWHAHREDAVLEVSDILRKGQAFLAGGSTEITSQAEFRCEACGRGSNL